MFLVVVLQVSDPLGVIFLQEGSSRARFFVLFLSFFLRSLLILLPQVDKGFSSLRSSPTFLLPLPLVQAVGEDLHGVLEICVSNVVRHGQLGVLQEVVPFELGVHSFEENPDFFCGVPQVVQVHVGSKVRRHVDDKEGKVGKESHLSPVVHFVFSDFHPSICLLEEGLAGPPEVHPAVLGNAQTHGMQHVSQRNFVHLVLNLHMLPLVDELVEYLFPHFLVVPPHHVAGFHFSRHVVEKHVCHGHCVGVPIRRGGRRVLRVIFLQYVVRKDLVDPLGKSPLFVFPLAVFSELKERLVQMFWVLFLQPGVLGEEVQPRCFSAGLRRNLCEDLKFVFGTVGVKSAQDLCLEYFVSSADEWHGVPLNTFEYLSSFGFLF
mmetsp:Transcript_18074/g.44949  ORF Transcript_18074/g.44949 Transcript_18074/m.44949 type:complete len:376 (-) Transcript_18074:5704-6831(-)